MRCTLFFAILTSWPVFLLAQPVELPSLSIEGTRIDAAVSYDGARGVYRYCYTLVAPSTNKAAVGNFRIDITGRVPRPQLDPDLAGNVARDEAEGVVLQPPTTIPVGITVPDPVQWSATVGKPGWVGFRKRFGGISPGTTASEIIVESKLPPGIRTAYIKPSGRIWSDITLASPAGTEFHPDSVEAFEIKVDVIGPSDPDETALFLGGGQSPHEVNPFLRYAAPTEARTTLAPGTASYRVVVFYGRTIDPGTFSAELNGATATTLFHPIAGTAEVITIPLLPGSNKLKLSVEGTTSGGRTGRDADTLTFLVE